MARYFPSALNVSNRLCLVIGNDREALEKSLRLLDAGARVQALAPSFSPAHEKKLVAAGATVLRADYGATKVSPDLFLVMLCPKDDAALTERIAAECRRERVLLCAIDQPAYCDVVNVSVMKAGRLLITIGTSGAAPAMARKIREGLERSLKKTDVAAHADHLASLRKRFEGEIPDLAARRRALIKATDGFEFEARIRLPKGWEKGKK